MPDLTAIAAAHYAAEGFCNECGCDWPCDADIVLAEVARLTEALRMERFITKPRDPESISVLEAEEYGRDTERARIREAAQPKIDELRTAEHEADKAHDWPMADRWRYTANGMDTLLAIVDSDK